MRSALLLALLLATPAAAQEAPAWEGYWSADARWCVNAGRPGEEAPDWYGRDGLFGLEWSCEIRGVTETGVGQSWVMQLDCLDAGYAYQQAQIFLLTPFDRLLVISEDGSSSDLVRCKGAP